MVVRAGELELRVEDGPLADRCRNAARALKARTDLELTILKPDEPHDPDLPRIVIGNWETPGIEPLAEALGLKRRKAGGFIYNGQTYGRPGDAVVAWFADPEQKDQPVGFYFSNELEDLIPIITDFMPAAVPSILCYHAGELYFEGRLSRAGTVKQVTSSSTWNAWEEYKTRSVSAWGPHLHSTAPEELEPARKEAYLAAAVKARSRAAKWFQLDEDQLSVRFRFHSQLEDLQRLSRMSALATSNLEQPGAQVLLAPGVPDDGGAAAILALISKAYGPPADSWVGEGMSVAAAAMWWGRPLEEQLGRIASAGIFRSPEELVDSAAEQTYSPHLRAPLRALLFSLAIESADSDRALKLWTRAEPLVLDEALVAAYHSRLAQAEMAFVAPTRTIDLESYRGGFALESERDSHARDGRLMRGYGTRGSDSVIEKAHAMGANAVVLSTNAFMQNEWPRVPDPPMGYRRAATVSDAELASAVAKAHSLSMKVLLQPHLLTSPTGIAAGRQSWSGEASFNRMLDGYERFIEHYALLAELLDIEILCFGTELLGAMDFVPDRRRRNVNHELIDAKRARWIAMIERTRGCFGGALTYAVPSSNRGFAIRDFELWEHFDFVAAALFQPLDRESWRTSDDVGRLEEQLMALSDRARAVDRPLLILPIGFPASLRAAIDPKAPGRDGGGVYMDRQAKLYRALGRALSSARERGDLAGAYLWSFSTNPSQAGPADAGFTPLGKLAERWLPTIFGQ